MSGIRVDSSGLGQGRVAEF